MSFMEFYAKIGKAGLKLAEEEGYWEICFLILEKALSILA
jgi:hypothetical protein